MDHNIYKIMFYFTPMLLQLYSLPLDFLYSRPMLASFFSLKKGFFVAIFYCIIVLIIPSVKMGNEYYMKTFQIVSVCGQQKWLRPHIGLKKYFIITLWKLSLALYFNKKLAIKNNKFKSSIRSVKI